MHLSEGIIGNAYTIESIHLPDQLQHRLEAIGMTNGTPITVLNQKGNGILIIRLRETRFALGRNITKNIVVR